MSHIDWTTKTNETYLQNLDTIIRYWRNLREEADINDNEAEYRRANLELGRLYERKGAGEVYEPLF